MPSSLSSAGRSNKLAHLEEALAALSQELDSLTPEETAGIEQVWSGSSRFQSMIEIARSVARFPEENPNPILRIDLEGTLLYANQASYDLLAHFDCQVGQPGIGFFQEIAQTAGRMGERKTVSLECGGKIYSLDVVPIQETGYINIYGRDVTERRQFTHKLQELLAENERQKAVLDAIFEADPSGLAVLVGAELRFAFVNPAYRYLTPDLMLDPVGRTYDQVWPEVSKYGNRDRFRHVIEVGQPFQVTGIAHQFPDGSSRSFTLQARRIRWEDQAACLMILWDVTDLETIQRQLIAELQQRTQIERSLSDGPVRELQGIESTLASLLGQVRSESVRSQIQAVRATLEEQVAKLQEYAQGVE
jgi:PAS domain-containing protein